MDPIARLVVCLVVFGWSLACGGAQPRVLGAQIDIACEGIAVEVAAHTGDAPSPLVQAVCVKSLRRALGDAVLDAPVPDGGLD